MKPLTQRQAEFTALLAQGMSAKEIAGQLGIAVTTAQTTLQQARERVGAKTVAHLVAIAISKGFINVIPALIAALLIISMTFGGTHDMARRGPRLNRHHRRDVEYVISI